MALAQGAQVFADIGADHGRLSAVMLLSGARSALVADISAAALEKARKRLHALGLDNRATFAVADGLAALDALKQPPDTVFVLGMGGETIGGILHRGHTRLGGAALILGAQTDLPMVRRTVCEVGYRIRSEVIASAGGRDYVLMRCTPARADEAVYTERECMLGPGLLRAPSSEWQRVLKRREHLLQQEISAMEKAGLEKDRERLAMNRRELGYVTGQLRHM
ncbi:MAG TPA: tRNA (adenine(22)-N(1))-methyltransferase TrmK [Candidatus Limiplasma merdipullorum]|nr:tRNA (adenine(22)-N(1))-methyltransferase TrmK [Candidatus Limiplasma merdipullorum]